MVADDRTLADEVIDLAEIYAGDYPAPLSAWQQQLLRQLFSEPRPRACLAHAAGTAMARRNIQRLVIEQQVLHGEHVHVATPGGTFCAGGDPGCPLPQWERPGL
jgi:hypothetical protein